MRSTTLVLVAATAAALAACGRDDAPAAPGTPASSSPPAGQAAAESRGVGVVQSIDAANASLTIAHEPIPALGWPAMTMPFKVDRPDLLDGLAAGERIEFTLRGRDMSAVVTSIDRQK